MSFLSTFFSVGKYSDKEIAEAAGLYYGLGPIDSAVSASAAKAEANVTVNVNIGEQATTAGSKQFVPERAHDGEYHVIYKNQDDNTPSTSGKKTETQPKQESKHEGPEPQKPKAEKPPAQPKQEKADQAQAKPSDLKKNLEDAKNAIQPVPGPSANETKPEANPEPQKPKPDKTAEKAPAQPKQEKADQAQAKPSDLKKKLEESKHEGPEPQKPKAEKTAEKAAQPQPKQDNADQAGKAVPVEVTDQQAAHALNNGFDYTHFQNSQTQLPITVAQPIQQSQPPMPVTAPVLIYPANYRDLTPEQRCDHLATIINCGLLPGMHNPRPNMTVEQKLAEIKKHISFMDMPGRQIGQIRIDALLNMLASSSLKNAMNKYDAVDRANNPKLTEVPVGKYATGDQLARFDLAFEAKLKDPKKILVVLFSSVPNYDPIQAAWSGDMTIFTKEIQ